MKKCLPNIVESREAKIAQKEEQIARRDDRPSTDFDEEIKKARSLLKSLRRDPNLQPDDLFSQATRFVFAGERNDTPIIEEMKTSIYGGYKHGCWKLLDTSKVLTMAAKNALDRAYRAYAAHEWPRAVTCAYLLGKAIAELRAQVFLDHSHGSVAEPKRKGKYGPLLSLAVAARDRLLAKRGQKEIKLTAGEIYYEIRRDPANVRAQKRGSTEVWQYRTASGGWKDLPTLPGFRPQISRWGKNGLIIYGKR